MSTAPIHPVIGTNEDDIIQGTNMSDVISGRGGDDTIYANNGHDEVWGGSGNDLMYGNSGHDVMYGSGGPNYVQPTTIAITDDYPVRVIFEGETAGYRNSFGYYKVAEDGTIGSVAFIWENASLQGSGGDLISGVSDEYLDVDAGDEIGFFIVSNGYSYNDFDALGEGTLEYRNEDGSTATLSSIAPRLYHTATDGSETEIRVHSYHTAGYGDNVALNPDGILHTTGVLKTDMGTLTLGFEDLYNGGDMDFDDSVFTVDIGATNAQVLNAHYQSLSGGVDDDDDGEGATPPPVVTDENDTIYGGTGNDEIYGKAGNDHLYGESGSDEIHGGSGNDTIYGGTSNDLIYGNSDDDIIYGESATDTIYGGSGDDYIDGGTGSDILSGNSGDDYIVGGSGYDELHGNSGNDELHGGSGKDVLNGGSQNDYLYGDSGSDVLNGNSGDDHLYGGTGTDILNGGSGDDYFQTGKNHDVVNGGSGNDTVDYSWLTTSIRIDLHSKRTTGGDSDTLLGIENAIGGESDDWMRGDIRDNALNGGAGDDYIRGTKGTDSLTGGDGEDTFAWVFRDVAGSVDTITDFSFSDDIIEFDLAGGGAGNVEDWFSLVELGSTTTVYFDYDGTDEEYDMVAFVELTGVTDLEINDMTFIA